MGVGDINHIKLVGIFIIALVLLSISVYFSSAEVPTVVKGRVFIDNVKTKPDAVHLLLANEVLNATVYEDGSYILVASNTTPGTIGTFLIIYQTISYTPAETVTIEKNMSLYEIDLYVSISSNITEGPVSNPGGPYFEGIGIPLQFDGTKSNDLDGTITNYEWDFGDTTTALGATPIHIYQKDGNYTVTLTVIDNEGNAAQTSTYALITEKHNYPPDAPQLTGFTRGTITFPYNLTLQATDRDNDSLQYIVNWGDNTAITTTDFMLPGTVTIVIHRWANPGVYIIDAFAKDRNNATSQTANLTVIVNVVYIDAIGYFIDTQNDGTYEEFYSNVTGNVTLAQQNNNIYLIDTNGDGIFDHQYDLLMEKLTNYPASQPTNDLLLSTVIIFLVISFVFILGVLALMTSRKRTKELRPKETPEKSINHLYRPQKIDSVNITNTPMKEVEPRVDLVKSIEDEMKEVEQKVEMSKRTGEQVKEIPQKVDEAKITDEKLKEIRKKIDEILDKK